MQNAADPSSYHEALWLHSRLRYSLIQQVDFAEGLKASKVQEQSLDLSLSSKITEGRLGKHEEALKAGIKRRLTESSNEAIQQLDHPCLQSGYSKSYRRLVYKTAANPARVHLVGK